MRQKFMAQIPIPASDDFTREKEESKNGENMEMVVEGCMGERWNVEVKNEEEEGCNERSWKESRDAKECEPERESWL